MTKKGTLTSLATLMLVLAIAIVSAFFGMQLLKQPVSKNAEEIIFEVPPGVPFSQIAKDLQSKKLIRHGKAFQWYVRFQGLASKIKVGEYSLNQTMTPDEIINILVSGKSIARSLTVAEGLNIFDIAEIFEKQGICTRQEFFEIVHDQELIQSLIGEKIKSLEGYLFPETYKYTKYEGARAIVTQMVKMFINLWNSDFASQAQQMGWTRHQVLTLASIVEKETGAGFERPLISSVFHNRLVKKMRLQTDPTVLYGMAVRDKKMPTNITKNDLLTATPYNTYTNFGLPPSPIANPGKESIQAVFKPAASKYLYFVSQNNGTHVFSETLQQHNKAVQQYQMNARARENKSWRDLKQPKK